MRCRHSSINSRHLEDFALARWASEAPVFSFVVGVRFLFCLSGFGSAMEGPDFRFRTWHTCLLQPRASVVTWQTSEEISPEGISTTSFARPLGEVAGAFSVPSLGLWESPMGTTGETFEGP